ncbi:MAG: cytochrome P450 [Rhizobiaceae bacterium]|nr:cytochrome P450 [Rhizobiaceae bacterium]
MSRIIGPMPAIRKTRPSPLTRVVKGRHSSLDVLFERSYSMKMGEFAGIRRRFYFLTQPDVVNRILGEDVDLYPKSNLMGTILYQILGNGVFVSNGAVWKRQRRMMNPAFEFARISEVFPLMMQAAEAMKERLDAVADGREVAIDFEMTHVTADIIFRTIFSEPIPPEDAESIFDAFNHYQELAYIHGVWNMAGLPQALSIPRLRAIRHARNIRSPLARMVRKRFELLETGPAETPRDILQSLIDARDEDGSKFTEKELIDQIAVMFLAGHETSASALSWALYLMARDREVQERMHAETELAFDQEGGLQPRHFKFLKLTRDVFRETLRLYPPVSFVPRDVTVPETIRDKKLRKGSAIFISLWLMQRHREIWKNPDTFDPDRFSREEEKDAIRSAYMPFSQGPRVCLGASFALQEAAIILSMIARHYEIAPVEGHVPKPVARLTLRSENGIRLRVRKRV